MNDELAQEFYEGLSDQLLVELHGSTQDDFRRVRERLDRMTFELERRMLARGATAIAHPAYDVKLETPSTVDPERLRPLAELIPPEEWQRGFREAHEETITMQVPAAVDMRVVRAWTKYGTEVATKIEAAKVPGKPKVTVKAKPKKQEQSPCPS